MHPWAVEATIPRSGGDRVPEVELCILRPWRLAGKLEAGRIVDRGTSGAGSTESRRPTSGAVEEGISCFHPAELACGLDDSHKTSPLRCCEISFFFSTLGFELSQSTQINARLRKRQEEDDLNIAKGI